jgi:hypothetical protein
MDVGSTLAAQDTAATAPAEGTPFRLRLNLHMSGSSANTNAVQYKLKFAPKGASASCDLVATGSYTDVTDTSTIQYYNNTNAVNGLDLIANANDPVHAGDVGVSRQSYQEKGTGIFTNTHSIPVNQDGMWDFALVAYHSLQNDRYCFKVFNSNDTVINTYSQIPELIIPPATFSQAAYRWYNPEPSGTNTTFAKAYGDSNSQSGSVSILTSDGGYASIATGSGSGNFVGYLSKYSAGGSLEWNYGLGIQDGGVILSGLAQTSDGGFVVVGQTQYGASDDILVAKVNSIGSTIVWTNTWGGVQSDGANAVCVDSSGNIIVVGSTSSYTAGLTDAVVLRYDMDGNFYSAKSFGGGGFDQAMSVAPTSDGGFITAGNAGSFGDPGGTFIAKYDSSAAFSWSKVLGGVNSDDGLAIKQTSDGGYIFVGDTESYSSDTSQNALITKLASDGTTTWSMVWGGTGPYDTFNDVIQTSDGGFAVTGYTQNYGAGTSNVVLAKYNSLGTLIWDRVWGDSGNQQGFSLAETPDGGFIVGGITNSHTAGSLDTLLLKYDSSAMINGCTAPMCQDPSVAINASSGLATSNPSPAPTITDGSAGDQGPVYAVDIGASSFQTTLIVGQAITVGLPLADLNKGLDLSTLTPLNLRIAVAVDSAGIDVNDSTFKLQYALRGNATSCSTVGSGSYEDVTGSTPIAYYDDNMHSTGDVITDNPEDPKDGDRQMIAQTYQETNNFSNSASAVYAGQDGMWQFSLAINNNTLKGHDFCLRVYSVTGSSILTAANVADVAYAPQMTQMMRNGKWFSRAGKLQPYSL